MGIDFHDSYDPISHTHHICTCVSVVYSLGCNIYVIDATNDFKIPIVSEPSICTYLSLIYKYKDWYKNKWPNDPILFILLSIYSFPVYVVFKELRGWI